LSARLRVHDALVTKNSLITSPFLSSRGEKRGEIPLLVPKKKKCRIIINSPNHHREEKKKDLWQP